MKNYRNLIFALVACLSLAACSVSQPVSDPDKKSGGTSDGPVYEIENPQSLAEILMRVPGVIVSQGGSATSVSIRGATPLFVVDNMPVGHSYASAANVVNVHDIASVEVLKSASETAIYGYEGRNGVIIIRTGFSRDDN